MYSYIIIHIDKYQNKKKITSHHHLDTIYYLTDYFLNMYKKNDINSLVKPTLNNCLSTGLGYFYNVSLDKKKDILYFTDDSEFLEKVETIPLTIQKIYSAENSEIPLEIYMIEQGILSASTIKFKNFCDLCEQWDQLYIHTPNYIVLYQTTADTQILLATFNTEQEAVDFVEGKQL